MGTVQCCRGWLEKARASRAVLLAVVYYTNFLDYLLLTAVVPIVPDFLVDSDRQNIIHQLKTETNISMLHDLADFNESCILPNTTVADSLMERVLRVPVRAISENSRVGWLLSSKAIVQLIANPVVGKLSNRISYQKLLVFGVWVFMGSSAIFAAADSYIPLLFARASQGIGSAATTIAGMSMIAERYPDDRERSRAMGTAMGGLAMGILVGYPFGGLLYALAGKAPPFVGIVLLCAINIGIQTGLLPQDSKHHVDAKPSPLHRLLLDPLIAICAGAIMFTSMSLAVLESTVPIWVMDSMKAEQWQLGLIFIPDSVGYLIGTNCFPVIAKTHGRWLFTTGSMLLIAFGMIAIPFCRSIVQLLTPHLCLGLGVGVADAAIMPLLALLVDQRHLATYGSVYAVVQLAVSLAYSLGPAVSGQLVKTVGFKWAMWGMACLNLVFAPLNWYLRSPKVEEDTEGIMYETDDIEEGSEGLCLYKPGQLYQAFD